MKPKVNRAGDASASKPFDRCQTPAYAIVPLLPYLKPHWVIWEPAAGERHLAAALRALTLSFGVVDTDIIDTPPCNFFECNPPRDFDAIVTNPPYSIKYEWLERCYSLGKPFALLVPVETIGAAKAQRLMEKNGAELLLLDRRVNFKMPNKGWKGSAAQFPVLWLCWQLLPAPIVYGKLPRQTREVVAEQAQLELLEAA